MNIDDSKIQNLKSNITANNFFDLDYEYGHSFEYNDLIPPTLSISMSNIKGQNAKTVYFNKKADFPENLAKIGNLISNNNSFYLSCFFE